MYNKLITILEIKGVLFFYFAVTFRPAMSAQAWLPQTYAGTVYDAERRSLSWVSLTES